MFGQVGRWWYERSNILFTRTNAHDENSTFFAGAGTGAADFFLRDKGTAAPASHTGLHALDSQLPSDDFSALASTNPAKTYDTGTHTNTKYT